MRWSYDFAATSTSVAHTLLLAPSDVARRGPVSALIRHHQHHAHVSSLFHLLGQDLERETHAWAESHDPTGKKIECVGSLMMNTHTRAIHGTLVGPPCQPASAATVHRNRGEGESSWPVIPQHRRYVTNRYDLQLKTGWIGQLSCSCSCAAVTAPVNRRLEPPTEDKQWDRL